MRTSGAGPATRPFDPRRGVAGLAAFGLGGLALSALYSVTGVGLPCPFRQLTGLDCPFCGGTRLGAALLHADLAGAFEANPMVLLALGVLTVLGGIWLIEAAGGPALRPPANVRRLSQRLGPTGWVFMALTAAVGFAVVRNLYVPR